MNRVAKVLSVLQPGYLPYGGFFELMARCDVFVIYDDVQYDKNSWRNRNQVLGSGGPTWLTVPVLTKGRFGQTIRETLIDNRANWSRKHHATLAQAYANTLHYGQHAPFFANIYQHPGARLLDLNLAIIDYLRRVLNITTEVVKSSDLASSGHKTARLVDICLELGAGAYISTNGAKSYLDAEMFRERGLQLAYQDYTPPVYDQGRSGFLSHLSVLDMLFRFGPATMPLILSTSCCPFNRPGHYRGLALDESLAHG